MKAAAFLLIFALAAGCPSAWAAYESKGKRNPFVPLLLPDGQRVNPPPDEEGAGPLGLGGISLQGVVYDPSGDSTVILNGRLLRENEEWEGIRILKIEANAVTIWKDGETQRLTTREPEEEKDIL
ncbi:MAG: hypothetical protein Q7J69_03555 [Candidatus Omnitrophota bacterium]|nr:hypothetical protein [Candidatus Omnitrophota bacterium]